MDNRHTNGHNGQAKLDGRSSQTENRYKTDVQIYRQTKNSFKTDVHFDKQTDNRDKTDMKIYIQTDGQNI